MNWQNIVEYQKLNHCIKLFGDVFFPKPEISDEGNSMKYSFYFSSESDDSMIISYVIYDKTTYLFTGTYAPSYGYNTKLDSPLALDESFSIECVDNENDIMKIISNTYIYPLLASTGINYSICLLADWIYYDNNNNINKFKYMNKMQKICEEYSKYQPQYNTNTLDLIPKKYKSYNVYLNYIRRTHNFKSLLEIVKQIPNNMKDYTMCSTFMNNIKLNCCKYIVGKDKYDKIIQYVPKELQKQFYEEYNRFIYPKDGIKLFNIL